jgi:hypothetical protein
MISLSQGDNILGLLLQQGARRERVTWHIYAERKIEKLSPPDNMLSGSIATTRRSAFFSSYFLASLLSCASSADS